VLNIVRKKRKKIPPKNILKKEYKFADRGVGVRGGPAQDTEIAAKILCW
jgi:hypothetical protein